jgi:hypothetical protein
MRGEDPISVLPDMGLPNTMTEGEYDALPEVWPGASR